MSTTTKLNELIKRRAEIENGGGDLALDNELGKNHLTARKRIDGLLDPLSFVEIGAFVTHRSTDFNLSEQRTPADGVVTGYGTIDGRLVYVYSQDATVLNGALGEMHAKKISHIYELALKMGAPVIGLVDSAGLRLQESTDALQGFGELFQKQAKASGIIPQIIAILGNCAGGTTFIPSLSDFTFMTKENSRLFVNSPNALDSKTATFDTFASAKFHSEETGLIDFVYESEEELLDGIKALVGILPSNHLDGVPMMETTDDLNRVTLELNALDLTDGVNARSMIKNISDNGFFIETKKDYGLSMVTGFIRLGGATVGVVGNHTLGSDGTLTSKACKKASKFIRVCNAFNIPLLTLVDVSGFHATVEEEKLGIGHTVSQMLYAFAETTVPKVTVILGRGYGSAYIAMNSKHIGADFVFAWPTAKIGMMPAHSAVKIMYADDLEKNQALLDEKVAEYEALQESPYAAASRGYIDDIIEPAATRKRVIAAFDMLQTKYEYQPSKKHGTIL